MICALENEARIISNLNELKTHVVNFYKQLFGSSRHTGLHLASAFWTHK
jgi:hypothetical protein